ncbi:hypothetical protein LOAG_03228 [Loa loa]|uniref:Uncharacterized protein n=1 Tax=Loa loa TaxID=7209 RepID=A0A1S0U4Z6_LOALO|nr:hypothetical protein LOAG_03228 [Loa loa]EFO25257.1 hypothetical protein LOAG_03228 [Loa loa]
MTDQQPVSLFSEKLSCKNEDIFIKLVRKKEENEWKREAQRSQGMGIVVGTEFTIPKKKEGEKEERRRRKEGIFYWKKQMKQIKNAKKLLGILSLEFLLFILGDYNGKKAAIQRKLTLPVLPLPPSIAKVEMEERRIKWSMTAAQIVQNCANNQIKLVAEANLTNLTKASYRKINFA